MSDWRNNDGDGHEGKPETDPSICEPMLSHLISDLIDQRKARGFTQAELGEITGLLQPGIARMEKVAKHSSNEPSRYKAPNFDTLLKVANALGMTFALVPIEQQKIS